MKNIARTIRYLTKSLILAICSSIVFQFAIMCMLILINPHHFFSEWHRGYLIESIALSGIAFFICLIFGTPILIITEIWFSHIPFRFIKGGAIASLIAWIVLDSDTSHTPFLPLAPGRFDWPLALIFMAMGTLTGILFTFAMWIYKKINKKLHAKK